MPACGSLRNTVRWRQAFCYLQEGHFSLQCGSPLGPRQGSPGAGGPAAFLPSICSSPSLGSALGSRLKPWLSLHRVGSAQCGLWLQDLCAQQTGSGSHSSRGPKLSPGSAHRPPQAGSFQGCSWQGEKAQLTLRLASGTCRCVCGGQVGSPRGNPWRGCHGQRRQSRWATPRPTPGVLTGSVQLSVCLT